MKQFTGDRFIVTQTLKFAFQSTGIIAEKGENGSNKHIGIAVRARFDLPLGTDAE